MFLGHSQADGALKRVRPTLPASFFHDPQPDAAPVRAARPPRSTPPPAGFFFARKGTSPMNAITAADDLLRKAVASPSEDIARTIMAQAGMRDDEIEKSITTSTGLVAYDLQAPAKNLYPVNTPIIKALPRVGGGVGSATNWKVVNAITGSGYDNSGWVPEGQRAGTMSYSVASKSAAYVTLGEEDNATFEAINAGRTFEDVQATMKRRLLQKMMLKEEMAVLFGNNSLSLGTPATPTLSSSGTGKTLPSATYSVIVVALTGEGYQNSSLSGGVATTKSITGADGKSFTLSGGSSQKSAAATQAISLGAQLNCSVTAIQGAVAYAWYVGTAGNEKLEAITTINSAVFSAPLAGTGQAASAVTADNSTNATAFDGLYTWATKSGSGAYVNNLATGAAGVGTTLTASGRGSIVEIDTMLQAMWDSSQVSVDVIFVNSQQLKDITTKVLSSASGPLLQYFQNPASGEYALTAGGHIEYYYNPFMQDGGQKVPIRIHPKVPPGTILGWCNNLPLQYQSNEVPNVAEVKTRQDYYAIDWPITTRQRQAGVYAEEVLAVYAPFAMGVIGNIAAG